MKNILFSIVILSVFALTSCKTTEVINPVTTGKSTNNIKVPTGFAWQNSRNVNYTVAVTDTRFQASIFLVSIYDGDPLTGGNLLAKGSATNLLAFKSRVFTSNQITEVYIVKTAPDNTKTTLKVQITAANVSSSVGI